MEKLIITVTCDSTMSFPRNPYNPTPKGIRAVAEEYVRSVNAGAAICHLHGPYTVDEEVQADGTKLSDLDIPGWGRLRQEILGSRNGGVQDAVDALAMMSAGIIRPRIDGRFPLDELPRALDYVRTGQPHGRVVIDIK